MIEDRDPTHACCWRVPVALQVRLLEPGVLARRRVPWATRTTRIIRTTARPHCTSYGSMPSPRLHVRGSDGAPYQLFAGAQASAPLTLSLVRGVGDAVDFQLGGVQQCDLAAVIAQPSKLRRAVLLPWRRRPVPMASDRTSLAMGGEESGQTASSALGAGSRRLSGSVRPTAYQSSEGCPAGVSGPQVPGS